MGKNIKASLKVIKGTVFLLLILPGLIFAGEVVEQIVAVVNEEPIFLSDLRRDEIFLGIGMDEPLTQQVQRRVDYHLLLHEAKRFIPEPPSEQDINREVQQIQRRFKDKATFLDRLKETGMDTGEFKKWVSDRIWVNTLLQDRIRFFIFITNEEVDRYTLQHPNLFIGVDMEKRNNQIRTLLASEREKTKTEEYIAQMKSRAHIQIHLKDGD
jgi:hypothetical protein